jgi:hypothetical protein
MESGAKDLYIGIMENGEVIKKEKLSDITQIPRVEFFLIAHYDNTYEGKSNKTHWYRYEIIDQEGNSLPLRKGGFEVNYIDTDHGYSNFYGRKILIYDNRKDKIYTYKSNTKGPRFLKEDLIPLLEELDRYGSWEARECFLENLILKEKIQKLEQKLDKME